MAKASLVHFLPQSLAAVAVSLLLLAGSSGAARAADPSLREIVGQLVILGFSGVQPDDGGVQRVKRDIDTGRIGGVLLQGHNIQSKAQVQALASFLATTKAPFPPFLAIEQEGGEIDRIGGKPGFSANYPSAAAIAQIDPGQAAQTYQAMARDLKEAGFNLNLAPVVDLNINPNNPVIGKMKRSYGRASEIVERYAGAFVRSHHAYGILTAIKYWPGTGSSSADPHRDLVDVTKSWKRQLEPQPFASMIDEQLADMVMVSNLYHSEWGEGEMRPASLSPTAITTMLRGNLGYNGVVITDDLQMRAVASGGRPTGRAIVQALGAGADIILFGNIIVYQVDAADLVYKSVESAIKRGELSQAALLESYRRVTALKASLRR